MNNKNEVCIGEDYYLQLIDKVNEYDRLKELYERIYNENCILRENHNINDIFESQFIFEDLNNEVEIIEEPQEHKIPEKIEYHQVRKNEVEVDYIEDGIVKHFCLNKKQRYFADKINEILDYLEKINE